jgi:hypothetical protein
MFVSIKVEALKPYRQYRRYRLGTGSQTVHSAFQSRSQRPLAPFLPTPHPIHSRRCLFYHLRPLSRARAFHSRKPATMADYNYGGTDEENVELKTLEVELVRLNCVT